jgi:hypothetical protein
MTPRLAPDPDHRREGQQLPGTHEIALPLPLLPRPVSRGGALGAQPTSPLPPPTAWDPWARPSRPSPCRCACPASRSVVPLHSRRACRAAMTAARQADPDPFPLPHARGSLHARPGVARCPPRPAVCSPPSAAAGQPDGVDEPARAPPYTSSPPAPWPGQFQSPRLSGSEVEEGPLTTLDPTPFHPMWLCPMWPFVWLRFDQPDRATSPIIREILFIQYMLCYKYVSYRSSYANSIRTSYVLKYYFVISYILINYLISCLFNGD